MQGHKAQVALPRLTSSQAATRSCTSASCAPTLSSSPSISSMIAVPYLDIGRGATQQLVGGQHSNVCKCHSAGRKQRKT